MANTEEFKAHRRYRESPRQKQRCLQVNGPGWSKGSVSFLRKELPTDRPAEWASRHDHLNELDPDAADEARFQINLHRFTQAVLWDTCHRVYSRMQRQEVGRLRKFRFLQIHSILAQANALYATSWETKGSHWVVLTEESFAIGSKKTNKELNKH